VKYLLVAMKVYVTDGNELIMESSIKWAGNSNVTFTDNGTPMGPIIQVTLMCVRVCDISKWMSWYFFMLKVLLIFKLWIFKFPFWFVLLWSCWSLSFLILPTSMSLSWKRLVIVECITPLLPTYYDIWSYYVPLIITLVMLNLLHLLLYFILNVEKTLKLCAHDWYPLVIILCPVQSIFTLLCPFNMQPHVDFDIIYGGGWYFGLSWSTLYFCGKRPI